MKLLTAKTYLIFQTITRIALCTYALFYKQVSFIELPLVFIFGLINDFISAAYFLPVMLVLILLGNLALSRFRLVYTPLCYLFYCGFIASLIFITAAELTFWDEFGTRFNFIAVDYLVYTHEIIGTVKESMPYIEIISGILIVSAITTYILRKAVIDVAYNINRKCCLATAIILAAI